MSNTSALDRLFNSNTDTRKNISVEEQLDDAKSTDDDTMFIFNGMSQESKQALYSRIQPETVEPEHIEPEYIEPEEPEAYIQRPEEIPVDEDDIPTEDEQEESVDETLVTPVKTKRGRKPKANNIMEKSNQYDSIIRTLALNLVNELIQSNYSYSGFNREDTCLLLDYIQNKIKGE